MGRDVGLRSLNDGATCGRIRAGLVAVQSCGENLPFYLGALRFSFDQ